MTIRDVRLEDAGDNVLRDAHFVKDPVSGLYKRATLIERAATNLLLRSEEFDDAAWSGSAGTVVTANDATAPDGALTADKIDDTDGALTTHWSQSVTVAADTTVRVASVFVRKRVGAPSATLRIDFGGSNNANVTVNPETGASLSFVIGTAVVAAAGVIDWNADWWLVYVAAANISVTTIIYRIYPAFQAPGVLSGSASAAETGHNHFWGAQLEVGHYPSSYIATTAAAATRNTDATATLATLPGVEAATIYHRAYVRETPGKQSVAGRLWQIGGAGANGPGLFLLGSVGTVDRYTAQFYYDAASGSTTAVVDHAVAYGDRLECLVKLYSDGRLQLLLRQNGGAEQDSGITAAPATMPTTWGSGGVVSLGGASGSSQYNHAIRGGPLVLPGTSWTMDEAEGVLEALLGEDA